MIANNIESVRCHDLGRRDPVLRHCLQRGRIMGPLGWRTEQEMWVSCLHIMAFSPCPWLQVPCSLFLWTRCLAFFGDLFPEMACACEARVAGALLPR